MIAPKDRVLVALDVGSIARTTALVESLSPWVGGFKIGLELLTYAGTPQIINHVHRLGGQIFLDGKFHDIPNTIGKASAAASSLGVKFFNVHASAGEEAIQAAAKHKGESLLLCVTVLTSFADSDALAIYGKSARDKVIEFSLMAQKAGADGIVCSAEEVEWINENPITRPLIKVTPGIRPTWAEGNDQKRILTPAQAIEKGATYLVIGRPITNPPRGIGSPVDAAKAIVEEISSVNNPTDLDKPGQS